MPQALISSNSRDVLLLITVGPATTMPSFVLTCTVLAILPGTAKNRNETTRALKFLKLSLFGCLGSVGLDRSFPNAGLGSQDTASVGERKITDCS
jgi:hypothetical protein